MLSSDKKPCQTRELAIIPGSGESDNLTGNLMVIRISLLLAKITSAHEFMTLNGDRFQGEHFWGVSD
jgi:hypothetical protein